MEQFSEKCRNNVEDLSEFLKAIREDRYNIELIECLIKRIDEIIEESVECECLNKLEMLRKKIVMLEKNLEVCSDEFLEESFYLLSFLNTKNKI